MTTNNPQPWEKRDINITSKKLTGTDVPPFLGGSDAHQGAIYIKVTSLLTNSGRKKSPDEKDQWSPNTFFPEINLNDTEGKQVKKITVTAPQLHGEKFDLKWHIYPGKPRNPRINGWVDGTWNPFLEKLDARVGDTLHLCGDWDDPESAKIYIEKSEDAELDRELGFEPGTVREFLKATEQDNSEDLEELQNSNLLKIPETKNLQMEFYSRLGKRTERREQGKLRDHLDLNGGGPHRCDICGSELPPDLLWAAHIKPRTKCDDREKGDLNVVMRACLTGCNHLYDKGWIGIDNGTITIAKSISSYSRLAQIMDELDGREIPIWNSSNKKYFSWHFKNIFEQG